MIIFFFFFGGGKFDIKTKKNKRNYFNFVLCYEIIRIAYFCFKTEKNTILFHFMTDLYQKFEKHACCFMVAMATGKPK